MKRSKFSLSNYKLLTCDMGQLVPIGLTEILPGDSVQQATSLLLRVSPLLAPVMHPVSVRIHHWFVPNRIIWSDWEKFITGGEDGLDASVFPTITLVNPAKGTLADYLGVPPAAAANRVVSALPFRAYAAVWNEWYRDQQLQAKVGLSTASGADATTNTSLLGVCWEKDYFTSARPDPQLGPDVSLPLGDAAPVEMIPGSSYNDQIIRYKNGTLPGSKSLATDANSRFYDGANAIVMDPSGNWQADLAGATAATVRELREALALQRYEEARARYGSRYTEYLRYLGVRSSDARLQRPEYLGGGKQTIQFSEIIQSAVTTSGTPDIGVGELKGHGISAMRSNRYRKFFEEHGYVVTMLSVRPKTMYCQGLARTWNRRTKEDFFQKELQHIGQQEILAKEVYADAGSPDATWGYQDRYDEYRRAESSISGDFRDTLDFWHMARIFGAAPSLNADFVLSNPTKRIHAVESQDVLWVMANHSIQARRMVDGQARAFVY